MALHTWHQAVTEAMSTLLTRGDGRATEAELRVYDHTIHEAMSALIQ